MTSHANALAEDEMLVVSETAPPTVVVAEQKRALLRRLLARREPRTYPLSFAQERIWFSEQLNGGTTSQHIVHALRIGAKVDPDRMRAAWQLVLDRHEALRTSIAERDGVAMQVVDPDAAPPWEFSDFSAQGVDDDESQGEAGAVAMAQRLFDQPFDLSRAPLLRLGLAWTGRDQSILIIVLHHIISDNHSVERVFLEARTAYLALETGVPPAFEGRYLQFGEYALRQRALHDLSSSVEDLGWWLRQLQGFHHLELPLDRARRGADVKAAKITRVLTVELTEALRKLQRQKGVTAFMLTLAAFKVALSRYVSHADVAVGTVMTGRNRPELRNSVGPYMNDLVLRTDFSGDPTFAELLLRVKRTVIDAFAHQEVPFEMLVREVPSERDGLRHPFFDVLFLFLQELSEQMGDGFTAVDVGHSTAKLDLSHLVIEERDRFVLIFEYNALLFEQETVEGLAAAVETALTRVAADSQVRLSEIFSGEQALVPREESVPLPVELDPAWNATARAWSSTSVVDMVEARFMTDASAPALEDDGCVWSYGRLDVESARMADHLRALDIGPEHIVAVALERSARQIAALLGVLRASAAYLPLDPCLPPQRIAYILESSRASLLITDTAAPAGWADRSVRPEKMKLRRAARPPVPAQRDRLAYVIYTSGSTGRPKGVMITHRALTNLVRWQTECFGVHAEQRGGYISGIGFDAAVLEIWAYLAAGATICIPPEHARLDPASLRDWAGESLLTQIFVPTPLAEKLMELSWGETSLLHVLTGGDRLTRALPPGIPWRLWNVYGPTETTVVATAALVERSIPSPPIGSPIANTRCYVLDAGLCPVAVGEAGELFLGGSGLARGYLAKPALTAASFIPDPFGSAGGRLYRTGDTVRRLASGVLEFVARADDQIKLRGYRIEPGEIETNLRNIDGVREVAVVARQDFGRAAQLVAYVVWRSRPDAPSPAQVRALLAQNLPDYMLPSVIMSLDALPLNVNGKVDRRALPAPAQADRVLAPPLPGIETELAQFWGQLLAEEKIGRDESFLELGGNSLMATQLASRIRVHFHVQLGLRIILGVATLAEQAELIATLRRSTTALIVEEPILEPVADGAFIPCSYAQERLWFVQQLEPGSSAYNITLPIRMRGALDIVRLERAIAAVVRHQQALRTVLVEVAGRVEQHFNCAPEHPLRRISVASEREASEAIRSEAETVFDLAKGPLVRWSLIEMGPEDRIFLICIHHVIIDGWSLGVLLNELAEAYQDPDKLRDSRIQYGDYAVWQRRWLDEPRMARQLQYWREQLAGVAPQLEMPLDRPRPLHPNRAGRVHRLAIGSDLARRLRAFATDHGTTLFVLLLTGFKALLHRSSGQQEIVVAAPVAGRDAFELEAIVGFFVNTLVLRTNLSGRPNLLELLRRVKETVLGAFENQHLPFHILVEQLAPERHPSWDPLVQAMFELQQIDPFRHQMQHVQLEMQPIDQHLTKFDLTLIVADAAHEEGLTAIFEYRTDLFDATTIERFGREWVALLEAALEDPTLDIAPSAFASRTEALPDVGMTNLAQSGGSLVPLILGWMTHSPEQVALVDEGGSWTYGQLAQECEQTVRRLRGRGVGPESLVAIRAERSARQVAYMIAVLMSGAAYLPIDPGYPEDRIAYMLADSGATAIEALLADSSIEDGDAAEEVAAEALIHPDSLAYVIYTSGSTARPKGVMVSHSNLLNQGLWMREAFRLGPADRVIFKASAGFDASLLETVIPLAMGCSVHVLPPGREYDPEYLAAFLRERAVTYMDIVPALLESLIGIESLPALPDLRVVTCGGETLTPTLAAQAAERLSGTLFNTYGPTETTVQSTFWDCRLPAPGASVPIGVPVQNTACYVLDSRMQLVPTGVTGELHIGGAGVTRGYLKRPGLTADRFSPDPFTGVGGRMYRTGDLVRRRITGELDFLGRADLQIKLRGFRIEPGEIETALADAAGVSQAFVVLRNDWGPAPALVGYLVHSSDAALPSSDDIRRRLAQLLPEYMVPAAVIAVDRAPLTPHGKVDRRAFPRPELPQTIFDAPRTAMEQVVASIWERLLGTKVANRSEDFFALGGHSLLATKVISRIRLETGVALPLRSLFERPRLVDVARSIEAARAHSVGQADEPEPEPVDAGDGAAPSFAQQRLYFLHRLSPGSSNYNIPLQIAMRGAVDAERLERVIRRTVERHEMLRTVFVERDGRLVQVARSAPDIAFVRRFADSAEQAQEWAEAEAQWSFDLSAGPPVRWTLITIAPEEHLFLLTLHHIAADGWSVHLLFDELAAGYRSDQAMPAPRLQYAAFSQWQRLWLEGERLEQQLGYWRAKLVSIPPLLELPVDYPRPAVQSLDGSVRRLSIDHDGTERLRAFAHRQGTTLFTVLLSAFQLLLSRFTNETDITLGTPVAGRNRVEFEDLIGLFVNTLVLRTSLDGSPSITELIARTKETTLQAWMHQDIPFERLVEELVQHRTLAHAPLIQVMFGVQRIARMSQSSEVSFAVRDSELHSAKFDLTLSVEEGETLEAVVEYRTDLFREATIDRMARCWGAILEAFTAGDDLPVDEISLLDGAELAVVLEDRTRTATPAADALLVPDLIAAQAAAGPECVAVIELSSVWTYRELDEKANQLAHLLRERGAGADRCVAVLLPRSAQQLVALLAVLKTGAAYVPIDPVYPTERTLAMLRDAEPVALIAKQALSGWPGKTISPDAAESYSTRPLQVVINPAQLAYVIYTSGSTGRPKGVMISHASLANVVRWHRRELALDPSDRGSYLCGLGFDVSILDLWPPLASGAAVAIPDEEVRGNPERLRDWIVEQRLTVSFVSTLMAEKLLELAWPEETALRTLITGGDRLTRRPSVEAPWSFWNLYGPTETTVLATYGRVTSEGVGLPSVGPAIANVQCYVLDAHLNPVPLEVVGELYIGGAGVGRGYLKQPRLTADRFVPDPFGASGGRLYRSGDLVRRRADGSIDFVGRNDQQIKLRGFRIELAEIEVALNSTPGIVESVVVLRNDLGPSPALAAYVVMEPGRSLPLESKLRAALAVHLPEWMLPSVFVGLPALPVNASGKVDRRRLPATIVAKPQWQEPTAGVETGIAAIWSEVLGAPGIGREDSFFALGGHSLLAMQIVARVGAKLGVEVPLRTIFEAPTLQSFAARVAEFGGVAGPKLRPMAAKDAAPLSFAQRRLWFLDRFEPASSTYNIAIQTQLVGALDAERLEEAIQGVLQRHEILRTVYRVRGDEIVQQVQPNPQFALGKDEAASEEEATALAKAEAEKPFDLAAGPVLRWTLIRLSERRHWFLITVHHIAFDAGSLAVLTRELAGSYGGEAPAPALAVQYADYAQWQQQFVEEVLEDELTWWRQQMAGAPALADLPLDHQRPPVLGHAGAAATVELESELVDGLRELAGTHQATLYMILLAGFFALLSRYSNEQDLVVGTPISGRDRVELEGLIGLFVNTLALRCNVGAAFTFAQLLELTRTTVLEAQAHRQLPFERLIEELAPRRSLAYAPVVQVMFAFATSPAPTALAEIEVEALPSSSAAAKFDLMLHVQEREGALSANFEYRTDLFEEATLIHMGHHWKRLLQEMVSSPESEFSRVKIMEQSEYAKVLTTSCGLVRALRPQFIPARIAEQTFLRPHAPALLHNGLVWTYAKLAAESDRLASGLLQRNIGAEQVVAVRMTRSVQQIAALLGVMKAGAAYLPIDPEYPEERIDYMLADSRAAAVITDEGFCTEFEGFAGLPPRARIEPDQLAYVIYTSGSTGSPKAVGVSHANLVNLAEWHIESSSIGTLDVGSYCSGLAFDASVWELWPALAAGACVAIAPEIGRMDPEHFRDWLVRDQVTVAFAPTPMAERLIPLSWPDHAALRTLNTGGDRLTSRPPAHARWQMVNNYGPTECAVVASSDHLAPAENGLPAIGSPITNGRCYLLNYSLEPVPLNASGELYIGGAGVARGYLGKPSLTAWSFLPDPFGPPGSRMYRSGDLARRRRDGRMDFLGRADHQVKLRGVRIETGEIEALLRGMPEIDDAAAALQISALGEPLLAAYVVAAPGSALPSASALRSALAKKLPLAMLPAEIIRLPKLPVTANGKVDRKALPSVTRANYEWEQPASGLETTVAEIWQEVLLAATPGRGDDFFALGGHSLMATRVIARIRVKLGVELPISAFFRAPQLKDFANEVRQAALSPEREPLLLLGRGQENPVVFVHGLDGGLATYLELSQEIAPDRAIFGLPAPPLSLLSSMATLEDLARHHAHVLDERLPAEECTLIGWSYGGLLALEIARLLSSAGRRTKVIMLDTHVPTAEHAADGKIWVLRQPEGAPADAAPMIRENTRLLAAYLPRYFDGEVLLVRASQSEPGPWSDLVRSLDEQTVEGSHFEIMRSPRVAEIGASV